MAALQSTLDSFEKRYAKNSEKYKNTKEVLKKEIQSQADSYEEQIQDLKVDKYRIQEPQGAELIDYCDCFVFIIFVIFFLIFRRNVV